MHISAYSGMFRNYVGIFRTLSNIHNGAFSGPGGGKSHEFEEHMLLPFSFNSTGNSNNVDLQRVL